MTDKRIILLEWGSKAVHQTLWTYEGSHAVFVLTQEWGDDGEEYALHLVLDELEQIVQAARKYAEETCLK